jgi:hypothetical protein
VEVCDTTETHLSAGTTTASSLLRCFEVKKSLFSTRILEIFSPQYKGGRGTTQKSPAVQVDTSFQWILFRCPWIGESTGTHVSDWYWVKVGLLERMSTKVAVARHGKQYLVSNDLDLDQAAMRLLYRIPQNIEEAFRSLGTLEAFLGLRATHHRG